MSPSGRIRGTWGGEPKAHTSNIRWKHTTELGKQYMSTASVINDNYMLHWSGRSDFETMLYELPSTLFQDITLANDDGNTRILWTAVSTLERHEVFPVFLDSYTVTDARFRFFLFQQHQFPLILHLITSD